ncbi:hypothetical protein [Phosphitispora sp. TUW77]|uniref:hypothetical protein n=1 Tax=Phosphitispora sp. TUW77 TaxID=3152361 RepID=UPI003AB56E2D
MNNKAIVFIKNFSYALSSNFISLLISTLVVLIIPKLIGVQEYGYWQIYMFYSSYVGFMQFGWNDGIYLRYGGVKYQILDKKLFFSQFWMLTFSQVIIACIMVSISILYSENAERLFIFIMVAVNTVFMGVRAMPLFILQATNRIKDYALITVIGRYIYFILIIIFLLFGIREYKLMIAADLIGKIISLIYSMYVCRDLVAQKITLFYFSFRETFDNIKAGIKLMFANIASMLIVGTVRFGIERSWDVATFGKISLTISISKFIMIFLNAIGIIMFPILRRTKEENLSDIYSTMRDFLMIGLLGMLIIYYPINNVLSVWLPEYSESILYMALVFPVFIYEGKMVLLINTYFKTLRKEVLMLKVNVFSLISSVVTTFITVAILKNLNFVILSIVVLLAFRSILAEVLLSKLLQVNVIKDIVFESLLTIIFMISGWFINSWTTIFIYTFSYGVYLLLKRNDIYQTHKNIKSLMKA